MPLLDRWIAFRFFTNFVLIFVVMTLFAISIDTIIELDAYVKACQRAVDAGDYGSMWTAMPIAILDFNLPRVFQFYAFLVGLSCVAAAGFTLAQMVRARELVAMLAAGISLWRVGLAMLVVAVILNLLQLVNGEVLLPRLAPLLVREKSAILRPAADRFPLNVVQDGTGKLVLAQAFDPRDERAYGLLVLERDEKGAATRRVEAREATWNAERGGWDLIDGVAAGRSAPGTGDGREVRIDRRDAIDFIETDVSPKAILARRFRGFAQLLSTPQISALAREGGIEPEAATRLVGQRFAGALVNVMMLIIALPFFLVREPQKMLKPSVFCAATAVPGLLGSLLVMAVALPGIPPAVGVFLPVAALLPIAAWRVGALKT
jgi:lipopolysaccharide export LptBFGC system permease protein LptF